MTNAVCRADGRGWTGHDGAMTSKPKGTDVKSMTVADVMLDHPSWLVTVDGGACRAVRSGSSVWTVTCSRREGDGRHVYLDQIRGEGPAPVLDVIDSASVAGTDPVALALRAAGPVARLRNPDLWDAIATSIIRQVIRSGQARKLYRGFCHEHGGTVETSIGTVALFPSPDTVLALPDAEFARLGLAFKCGPLRSAARAYLEFGAKWLELDPERLLAEIQTVPRIGPWTAGATVADTTNDYALYPFADLAVRTWAKHLASGRSWPDTEPEFARAWQRLAKGQLSERTLLTLAWGVRHAHSTGTVAL